MPRVVLFLFAGLVTVSAQTNGPAARTNAAARFSFDNGTNTISGVDFISGAMVSRGTLVMTNSVPPISLIGTNFTVRPISLQEAVQMALQNNYAVQIMRRDPEIAQFNLRASYAVYEPALSLSATHSSVANPAGFDVITGAPLANESESDSFGVDVGPGISGYLPTGLRYQIGAGVTHSELSGRGDAYRGDAGISLVQPLLRGFWIDASRAEIMLNRKNLQISEWQFREQLLSTLSDVEISYYDLILRRENIKVQRSALDWANQLLRENKKRVEVGALAPLDEKQAESEVARYVAQLLQSEQAYTVQQNLLKNLITQNFEEWTDVILDPMETLVAVPASPELAESWRLGLSMRPELQQLRYTLERQNITLRFLRNQMWPALDLTGSYGHNSLNTSYRRAIDDLQRDDFQSYSYGVRLSIPLGNTRARNNYKAGKATKEQLLLQYKQLEQLIMMEIDNSVKLLQSQFQQVEATRQARLFAQDALAAEQKKYENGKSTSFLVLQFQRDLIQRRFEELSALADYNKALAGLAFSEGATLQRFNLTLNLQ